jgi:hypothetical protein
VFFKKAGVFEVHDIRNGSNGNPGFIDLTPRQSYAFRIKGHQGGDPNRFRATLNGQKMWDVYNTNMLKKGYSYVGMESFALCASMFTFASDLQSCFAITNAENGTCDWKPWQALRSTDGNYTKYWRVLIDGTHRAFRQVHCTEEFYNTYGCNPELRPGAYPLSAGMTCEEQDTCPDPAPPPPPPPPPPSNSWSGWERHDGSLATGSGLDATSWQPGNLRVVARSPGNNVWIKSWDCCTAWSVWTSVSSPSGGITSDPSITDSAPNVLHVFARGTDNAMWTRKWSGSSWGAWTSIGGGFTSGPDAMSVNGYVLVFARGNDNGLWQNTLNPQGSWSGWESLGGSLTSDPSVVASGCCKIVVFGRGSDGLLTYRFFDGNTGTWSAWLLPRVASFVLNSAPDASVFGADRIDIFASGGGSNELHHLYFNGGRWRSSWALVGGTLTGNPGAVSWGTNRIDVFIRGSDNVMYHRWCEPCDDIQ